MPDHAGFAAVIAVREHVLRTALQAGYANGAASAKRFEEDLSDAEIGLQANLFLGTPDIGCEGSANVLVVTLPMWGQVTVTLDDTAHLVDISGEMELTLTPAFTRGVPDVHPDNSLILAQIATVITARRWTATVHAGGTPADIVEIVTGSQFRTQFEATFRTAVVFGRISLPTIDVSFLGTVAQLATSVDARVRDGVLLLGLNFVGETKAFLGDVDQLQDFARNYDVAGVVHPDAMLLLLNDVYLRLVEEVAAADAGLDSFSISPRTGYFQVAGAVSKSGVTVNFSFRISPSMFHTRGGAYFSYLAKPRWAHSRTWPALEFRIENVTTDIDRSWCLILLDEVVFGILSLGMSVVYIEGMAQSASHNFGAAIKASNPGAPTARVRKSVPPPGGVAVRVALDAFEITELGLFVGITVRPAPTLAALYGPTLIPSTYRDERVQYRLRLPSGVSDSDPSLRVRWLLENVATGTVLEEADGAVAGRLTFEFSPAAFDWREFRVAARLYRRQANQVTEIALHSLTVRVREPLAPAAYVRWRWQGMNPQVGVDESTDAWAYRGEARVRRYSEWHRTDEPCLAVNTPSRYRYEVETADRLPFPLRQLEYHRKGLCPYCFFGGPTGLNATL